MPDNSEHLARVIIYSLISEESLMSSADAPTIIVYMPGSAVKSLMMVS